MSFNVLMQTCFSVGAPVVPSTVPQAAEEPVTPSQTPPICAGSKQPLSVAHWKHEAPRDVRQAVVVLSLPQGLLAMHWPAALQVEPLGQLPHCRVPPQPSASDPQTRPAAAQVVGTQLLTH